MSSKLLRRYNIVIAFNTGIPNMADAPARKPIGYKLVALPNGGRGLATLSIPRTATIVETSYTASYRGQSEGADAPRLMRTDDVLTLSIVPIGALPGAVVPSGTSIRNHNPLVYKVGQRTTTSLNTTSGKGDGIHFFWDSNTPRLWDKLFN